MFNPWIESQFLLSVNTSDVLTLLVAESTEICLYVMHVCARAHTAGKRTVGVLVKCHCQRFTRNSHLIKYTAPLLKNYTFQSSPFLDNIWNDKIENEPEEKDF